MFSSRSSIVFLFSFAFPILVSSIVSESKSSDECQFGECAAWHILLVPLLTDRFTQVPLLKAIIRSMLSGCRWYFPDQIQLEMFTKNASFVPIRDPILLPELDIMLSEFKFSTEDRAIRLGQWHNSVQMAVDKMNGTDENVRTEHSSSSEENKSSSEEEKAQRSRGRFIFVITDFEQSQSGHGSEFLGELDRQLAQSGIFFRNVRLQFDGHKQTQIIPGGHPSFREDINNISQNIVRVAIVEPALGVDAFQAIRPCPQLSDAEKIREYSYVQHFYYENWFQRNPRGALIGFGLFLCAMICAVLSYLFHLWELTRTRRKAARQQQQGNNPQIGIEQFWLPRVSICLLARLVDAITKNVGADVEVEEALREWQGELANQDWHGTVQLKHAAKSSQLNLLLASARFTPSRPLLSAGVDAVERSGCHRHQRSPSPSFPVHRMGSSLCKDEKVHDEQSNKVREEEAMPPRTEPIENANDGAVQNRQIEMELKRDRMEERRVVKILLLGSADSGKSTIAKQMRILHTNGFNEAELINYRYMLHTNYIGTFHYIARGITQLRIEVPSDEMELVDRFENSYSRFLDYDDMDMIKLISKFLAYTSTKAACQRFTEFYVPDNTAYLLAEASRILSPEYQPTVTDVIHARASTTGVHEITFGFRRFGIRLIDVGGQKTERRKWIHCFDSVSAILYVISLSCYDQFLEEDPSINRMDDSIELFRAMFYNQFLAKCSFILFLNKKDLFEQKLKYVPLQKFYPPFEDCLKNMTIEDHYGEAVEFIKKLFLEVKDPDSNRHIYTHVTNATDTKNIEFVFGATCDIVLQNNLTKAGMT